MPQGSPRPAAGSSKAPSRAHGLAACPEPFAPNSFAAKSTSSFRRISCSPLHWLLDSASLEAGIWVQTGQELLEKWDARAPRLYLRMEVTGEGLVLGARTILAKMARDERGAPFLFL